MATNVMKPDGTRAVGTRLAPDPVHDAVLGQGRGYRGEAEVLGATYLVRYEPIRDAGGTTIGILSVSVKKADFLTSLDALTRHALFVGLVVSLASVALLWLALHRAMLLLRALTQVVGDLTAGQLDRVVPGADRRDEVGAMARAVRTLRDQALERHALEAQAAAGTAGKGFAVVAAEVKALAEQTAKAAQEIIARVAEIQAGTRRAVAANEEVAGRMAAILSAATSVAAAVEEQDAATHEIARSVQKAADGTHMLAGGVTGGRAAAGETAGTAGGVLEAARTMRSQSAEIEAQARAFVLALRRGPMDRRQGRSDDRGVERRAVEVSAA